MTAFVKVVNGIVVQKQPYPGDGFLAAPDHVVCGFLHDGNAFSAPPLSEQEAPPARIAKNAIWERASEHEAEVMEALLAQQHIRIRRIYEGATHISADHELFVLLSAALVQAFGSERAAELLAPTN